MFNTTNSSSEDFLFKFPSHHLWAQYDVQGNRLRVYGDKC